MADFETISMSAQQHAWDFESYDKSVARLCNALTLVDSNGIPTSRPVPLVFATPERAWARMRKKFHKNISSDREFKIPLPFLSVQQVGDTTFDPRRYLYKKTLYRRVALDTDGYTDCLSHPHPLPYTFQYSIELWTKTRYEARVNCAQWAGLWEDGGMLYRLVDHGTPMGVKYVPFYLEGLTDNTNLDPVDQQRSLRWTFTVRVDGWLPPVTVQQKLVHNIDISVETPPELCAEDDPYTDYELFSIEPSVKGNPATGEVVEGDADFDDDYTGIDFRRARFNVGNECLEL